MGVSPPADATSFPSRNPDIDSLTLELPVREKSPLLDSARADPQDGFGSDVASIDHHLQPAVVSALPAAQRASLELPDDSEDDGLASPTSPLHTPEPVPDPGVPAASAPRMDAPASTSSPSLADIQSAVIAVVDHQTIHDRSMKILSQALPLPTARGQLFPSIVQAIRTHVTPARVTFISLLHAVSGHCKLSELPHTPPSTPSLAVGGDSYFTPRVFDSAVSAVEYEDEYTQANPDDFALAAPGSLQLSIVERYIPPLSISEADGAFSVFGQSLLADRLLELSPHGGSALLVYPTKRGGQVFMSDYLSPSLDPTLRYLTSLYNLTEGFGQRIDSSEAVKHLLDFDDMVGATDQLIEDLNSGVSPLQDRLSGPCAAFKLVYSAKHTVQIDAPTWVKWWWAQEEARIKSAILMYLRTSRLPNQPEVRQATLLQELLGGIEMRAGATNPRQGLEVGVLLIQRG